MPIDVSQAMRSAVPPTYASFAFVTNPWPHLSQLQISKPHRGIAGRRLPETLTSQSISSTAAYFAPAATERLVIGSQSENS